MDNLTHSLVGLTVAKAGFDRATPYAVPLAVIAANAPDADIVTLLAGEWTYLHHHRGITHSIIGVLTIAVVLPFLFLGIDKLRARFGSDDGARRPPRFIPLLLTSLVASLTHPLLDWTNNYGVRPLLPWDASWFYGDLLFILDPWLWLSVGGCSFLLTATTRVRLIPWALLAMFLTGLIFVVPCRAGFPYPLISHALWLLGIAGLVVAYRFRAGARWGRGVAIAALAGIVIYLGGLSLVHRYAVTHARLDSSSITSIDGGVLKFAATPTLADPLMWRCLAETERSTFRFDYKIASGDDASISNVRRFAKPTNEAEQTRIEAAKQDARASVFLNFARFPAVRASRDCIGQTLIEFADLRYTEPGAQRRGTFSLTVVVPNED
ncbi:MAG: metal-dependent hydrolase [Pyrinomonadaceae bacterium MAG19_C2-C3]|nr:metal-dependent hydrolase [Pyrinomonadaceae bacterium MAG19_C2-C3]